MPLSELKLLVKAEHAVGLLIQVFIQLNKVSLSTTAGYTPHLRPRLAWLVAAQLDSSL